MNNSCYQSLHVLNLSKQIQINSIRQIESLSLSIRQAHHYRQLLQMFSCCIDYKHLNLEPSSINT